MRKCLIFEHIKSYLVVLVVAIIFMAVVNFINIKVMERDIIQKNALLLEHVKTTFDSKFIDISNLSFGIERNEYNKNIMKASTVDKIDAYKLSKDLYIHKTSNHMINEIFIYYPKHNMVITNSGIFTLRGFYRLNHKYDAAYFKEFKKMLDATHFREYKVSKDVSLNGEEKTNMIYYNSFPSGTQSSKLAVLGITIDTGKMVQEIKNIALSNSEYFAVLDNRNILVSYSGNAQLAELISNMDFRSNNDINPIAKDSTIIFHTSSSFDNINYVSICARNTLLKKINMLRNAAICCGLLILIVDFFIAFYFSKKSEKPIKIITEALGVSNENKRVEREAYKYIENRIKFIMDENKKFSSKLKKQTLIIKNNFLWRLLRGEISDTSACLQLAANYSIDVFRETYAVLLIYIESISSVVVQNSSDSDEDTNILLSLIRTVIIETFKGRASAELVDIDGVHTALLSLDIGENQEDLLLEYVDELIRVLKEDYMIGIRVAAGSMCKSLEQIPMSYFEGLKTLEQLLINKNQRYMSYSILKKTEQKDKLKNLDILSMFVNYNDPHCQDNFLAFLS